MLEYAMRPALAAGLAAAGAAALAATPTVDGPGAFLVGLAGLVLLAEGLRGALLRPVLRVTDDGLDVAVVLQPAHVPWADVAAVRTSRHERRLVRSVWVEIDTGERLLAVPAYRLGAPAAEVVEAVNTRAAAPRPEAG